MLTAFMIVGAGTQAAFAFLLITMCLAVAGTVVWTICNSGM